MVMQREFSNPSNPEKITPASSWAESPEPGGYVPCQPVPDCILNCLH
jgi:hypothetical protein